MHKKAKVSEKCADIYITKGINKKGIGKMGLNITHSTDLFQFENKDNLGNAAKNLLNRQGASQQSVQNIINKTIFNTDNQLKEVYTNQQLAVIKASAQVSMNESLKETIKYLKKHAAKQPQKSPVLGEIWDLTSKLKDETPYNGELLDFEIDSSLKNIFAA